MEHFRVYVKDQKPLEFAIEWLYQKPLKECSLQELIDGIVLNREYVRSGLDRITQKMMTITQ